MEKKTVGVELGKAGLAHRLAYPPVLALARLLWRTVGHGLENIPADTPYILAPNHASFLDGPVLLNAMRERRPRQEDISFVAWSGSAENSKFVKFAFEAMNVITCEDRTGSPATLRHCVKWLKGGRNLVIFPEGRRTQDGTINSFIPGVGFISRMSGAPIVPVAMRGMFQIMPKGAAMPHFFANGHRIVADVTFLPPVYPQGRDARVITAEVEQAVRDELARQQ